MIGFPIALVFANGLEWYAHNKLLHGTPQGPGKPRYSPMPVAMKSHWIHHKNVRTQQYRDDGYDEGLRNWRTRGELGNVLKATAITSLLWPVAPFFVLGSYYAAGNYFYTHANYVVMASNTIIALALNQVDVQRIFQIRIEPRDDAS